jgi:endonuclease/exonuclease/phosphatase (EEP) superfamily protein YafD
MRVAVYNQMFGLDGRNLFSFLLGHWNVHYRNSGRNFSEKINLDGTFGIVERSEADIVGISEILEGQEVNLTEGLRRIGYSHIFFGGGHKTKFGGLTVQTAIASKLECEKRDAGNFPIRNEMGGGGGFVHCYFPEKDIDVINLHLASPKKRELYQSQLNFVNDYVGRFEGNVILMGDFNKSYESMEPSFEGVNFVSEARKTCPTTFGLGFLCKDLDHIFSRGFEKKGVGCLDGKSDHRLVYVDLE